MLTTGVDYADVTHSLNNGIVDTFKFTNGNDIVEASNITLGSGDILIDSSTGDNDKLNLSLTSSFTANKDITISNIETINLFNNSAAVRSVDLSAANITGVKTINVFGNNKLSLNVSTLTDNVTINGNGANNSIVAGKGNDVINAGSGVNDLTGGKGADTFMITGNDTIRDLGDGADILNIAEDASAKAFVTGKFVANESNYINDGTVEFIVAANGVLDLSKADGNIESISISGTGAEVVGTVGDDTITVGSGASGTVEGGEGDDTINLASGHSATTIIFEKTAAANGEDTITNFTSNKDKLDLSAFVAKGTAASVASASGLDLVTNNYSIVNAVGAGELKESDITALAVSGSAKVAANTKYVVAIGDFSNGNGGTIYYVTTGDLNNDGTALASATIEKVGTISADTLVAGDFA